METLLKEVNLTIQENAKDAIAFAQLGLYQKAYELKIENDTLKKVLIKIKALCVN